MASAVILAAGKGLRMGGQTQKQYLMLGETPVLCHTLKVFDSVDEISEIVLVVSRSNQKFCRAEILKYSNMKTYVKIVSGGEKRQDSVYNGLISTTNKDDIVVIHDGVRPFVTQENIKECIKKAKSCKALTMAVPVHDTLKEVRQDKSIEKTIDREKIWFTQTPQAFAYNLILDAHENAKTTGFLGTDDASLVEELGVSVYVVMGSKFNIKITTKEDLALAEAMLRNRLEIN